ncbi:transglutaminase domain-containing protein [Paludibacter jiangxiensis]|uniref:Transglutaminase-like superfamily protein n=1 Tax=Paludibacter jiangxiensis TaxID=681398 RepID=A0A161LT62_9BACT|nr:transglutaminase domain-containing protein [Paludibacter jiangxiensis]GAT64100.1 transglutaminase-like superfamily protein [Paludibacter jiangxiensis]
MRFKILFLLLLCISLHSQAQTDYPSVDQIALRLPESESKTINGIAAYINSHFNTPDDKARAIFCWITHNIAYDVENMYKVNLYQNTNDIVERTLNTRKGICMSYTELFNAIAAKTGLKSFAVQGYTKQNNKVDILPHAWNAVLIGLEWSLIDATWGAGYIQNGKFVRHIENRNFKPNPRQFINTHIPFDPLWQMLDYTVTNQDFYEGKTGSANKKIFNYKDSLSEYQTLPESKQLSDASRRVEANGVKNAMIYEHLQHLHQQLEYLHNYKMTDLFNQAVAHYNNGIALMNQFINYRNNQFNPKKEDKEIRQMVDTVSIELSASQSRLSEIQKPDAQTAASITQLNKSLEQATAGMNEQKAFVDKYFKTGKLFRKTLFYKYTLMGIPVR